LLLGNPAQNGAGKNVAGEEKAQRPLKKQLPNLYNRRKPKTFLALKKNVESFS
jgi:hypothetical protein